MENNVQPKDVSRKEALKKIGYGALTAGTMMFLLNGTAKAGDNNWGDWDDINESNGVSLKRGGGSQSSGNSNCGPSASPDTGTGEWDKSSIQVKADGYKCDQPPGRYTACFIIKNVGEDMQFTSTYAIYVDGMESGGDAGTFKLDRNETLQVCYVGMLPANNVKVRLVAQQHPLHPGGGNPHGGPTDDINVNCRTR